MPWTKNQERAIYDSGKNILVSAGAGSGKTAVLTERVIEKIKNNSHINRLLILTFTRLAAGEMKQRIRQKLEDNNLEDELAYLDSSYITTFDSFAFSIVKKYHINLGIAKDISIMDSSIEKIKTKEIIDNIFEKSYQNENFKKLIGDFSLKDDSQIKDIFNKFQSKLDLNINKKDYLDSYIDKFYSPNNLDSIISSFEKELVLFKDTIKGDYELLKDCVDEKYLNAFNLENLIEASSYKEIKSSLSLIGSPRKNSSCTDDYKIYKDKINDIISKLKDLTRFDDIIDMKEKILLTKDYASEFINLKKEFDKEFLEYKRINNLYTFNDIAFMAINLVRKNSDIRNEISSSFDEIMIDEYQDTSDIQEAFINEISHNNVYMVGDIKQSIYRFRNANPYIFRDKYQKYENGIEGEKIDLLENFRSRKEVLDNINEIFDLIMSIGIGDADYQKTHRMIFGNKDYDNIYKTNDNHNMEVLEYCCEDKTYSKDEIEGFIIANDIKEKIKSKMLVKDKKDPILREARYSDFCIIMDRGSSFDLYKKIFEYYSIPLCEIKNVSLTSTDDLKAIINLIRLVVKVNLKEYDDEFKFLFASVERSFIINDSDNNLFDYVTKNEYYKSTLYNKCKSINIFEMSNLELLEKIIKEFDIYEKLLTIMSIKDALIKLDFLKDFSITLEKNGYSPIEFSSFLNEVKMNESLEYSISDDNSDSVKIINIHKSKGLEYSICYFAGLDKAFNESDIKAKFIMDNNFNMILPYSNDGVKEPILKDLFILEENKKVISEKIRLFYVALTRCREKMIMLLPHNEKNNGSSCVISDPEKLKYRKISDMLYSIYPVLSKYVKNIDLNKLNLNHDYDKKKHLVIENNNITKIERRFNDIEYEELNTNHFSKESHALISCEEKMNMEYGIKVHEILEYDDFKNPTDEVTKKFIKHIDNDYLNIYREYEFEYDNKIGFIDLIVEYNDHIDIIDYKLKNIVDDAYKTQIKGYKDYIESISSKKVYTYLYSILNDTLEKID